MSVSYTNIISCPYHVPILHYHIHIIVKDRCNAMETKNRLCVIVNYFTINKIKACLFVIKNFYEICEFFSCNGYNKYYFWIM